MTITDNPVEIAALALAARKMGLVKDPDGSQLPDDLWQQAIPHARAALEMQHLRGLLWFAWTELNAIRARDGVPRDYNGHRVGIDEQYWSDLVHKIGEALGDDAQPWQSEAAKTIFAPIDEASNG